MSDALLLVGLGAAAFGILVGLGTESFLLGGGAAVVMFGAGFVKAQQHAEAARQRLVDLEVEEARERHRRDQLHKRYGDPAVVDRILAKKFWQGMTAQMLRDSLGAPHAKDEKVMKTKTKEIWKYGPLPRRSHRLKVTLENGVVGWEKNQG